MNIPKTPWVVYCPKETCYSGIDSNYGEGVEVIIWGESHEEAGVRGNDSDESYHNAQAIVSAVNATYGNSINPEAVKEMYDVISEFAKSYERVNLASYALLDRAKAVLEKAKL